MFQEVAELGALLRKLDAVVGTTVRPEVAIVYDWESRWALGLTQGPRQGQGGWDGRFENEYIRTLTDHYRPFWKLGISVDMVESLSAFDRYRLVVAPMLFMLKPGVADRLVAWVKGGGTWVLDLPLRHRQRDEHRLPGRLAGRRPPQGGRDLGGGDRLALPGRRPAHRRRGREHDRPRRRAPGAGVLRAGAPGGGTVLATFKNDFYAGMPALTVNRHGAGRVYYLAARPGEDACTTASRAASCARMKLARCLDVELPEGVTVQKRSGGGRTFLFLHNFAPREQALDLGGTRLVDVADGTRSPGG